MIYDVCVIGAGPAGLAFAYALRNQHNLKILVIDSGKKLEDRDKSDPKDIICGEGGAGLWSDGKFSFYPAGTAVYGIDNIEPAYEQLDELFKQFNIDIPPFPHQTEPACSLDNQTDRFVQKPYPSFYLTMEDREKLIQTLSNGSNAEFMFGFKMHRLLFKEEGIIHVELENETLFPCKHVVFAGGRFGPRSLNTFVKFRRYELGVRIEVPSHYTLFNGSVENFIDPKFIHVDPETNIEYRTFCVCRNGSVIDTCCNGIWSCSGSSEIDDGIHNVGFNMRVKSNHDWWDWDKTTDRSWYTVETQEKTWLYSNNEPFHHATFEDLVHVKGPFHFGKEVSDMIAKGLIKLREQFPEFASDDVRFSGPTIEGIGYYPDIDYKTLEAHPQITVIGDSSGIFRGTVPALLSGFAAAQKFIQ